MVTYMQSLLSYSHELLFHNSSRIITYVATLSYICTLLIHYVNYSPSSINLYIILL